MTTNNTTDSQTQKPSKSVSTDGYLTRKDIAEALGVDPYRLRNYCDTSTDAYFGAAKGQKGSVYPPSAVELFRQALDVPPSYFKESIAKIKESGATFPGIATPAPGTGLQTVSTSDIIEVEITPEQNRLIDSATHKLRDLLIEAIRPILPVPSDSLLTAEEARKKLGGRIPKGIKPLLKSPLRYSNRQIEEYIKRLIDSQA